VVEQDHLEQILDAVKDVKAAVAALDRRTTAIENARNEARSTYEANWSDIRKRQDDTRHRLERIEFQTKHTNGTVTMLQAAVAKLEGVVDELREWKAYMSGVASSFSWWKAALGAIVAGFVLFLLLQTHS
jgi:prefoldin subunit 5